MLNPYDELSSSEIHEPIPMPELLSSVLPAIITSFEDLDSSDLHQYEKKGESENDDDHLAFLQSIENERIRHNLAIGQAKKDEQAEYHATVHDIPIDDRPRERLQKYGADTLTTSDLLAIILRTGTHKDNVIEMASKLVTKYGGLSGLMSASFTELSMEYGLGTAKSAQLKAALELGKRLCIEQPEKRYQIRSSSDAINLVKMDLMYLEHEEMHILIMDTKNQLVEHVKRYKGTVNSSVLRAAEIFRPAIVRNCPNVIICHNHPSGDPTPSPEDIYVTKQLVEAGKILDIDVLDHLVIGNPRYVSLKQKLNWS